MEKYCKMLITNGADLATDIDAETIVTAPWTVYRCRFGCDTYGKSHCCNPDHCNFLNKTAPAMEACGIDVFATVRNNGMEIHTLREMGEEQNHFGLILVE